MRIQHNITALNAYSNLTGNNNSVAKNLEKLSSGYRINRAGDDAAGLAISEKMRAQITGLDTAKKNANDGISLIQTTEGNLTEVHSMLNRMVELADQSANGTYQDKVDRDNLQKEVTSLKDEIDRISEGANYNGIKLLDGSLSAAGATSASGTKTAQGLDTEFNGAELTISDVAATKGSYTNGTALANGDIKNGETLELTTSLSNGKNIKISLTAKDYTDGTAGGELVGEDGTVYAKYAAGGATGPTAAELSKAVTGALRDSDIGKDFKVKDNADGTFTLTNAEAGAAAPRVLAAFNATIKNADGTIKSEATKGLTATRGTDAYQSIDGSQFTGKEYTGSDNSVLTINGKKFAIIVDQATSDATANLIKKASDAGLEIVRVSSVDDTAGTYAATGDGDLKLDVDDAATTGNDKKNDAAKLQGDNIAAALGKALGKNVTFVAATGDKNGTDAVASHFEFKSDTTIDPSKKKGAGLTLQIGESSEAFNQMTVTVNSMDTKSLGINTVDISTQAGAKTAVDLVKNAINSVSSTRGDLGALQNRLEHTINNLSVTSENMTAAESRIRDVDMAQEMMGLTKNKILVSASQAMLAQANQIPQGVLQLLQ
ncbi:flagellin N-terminal helical domain-containing protein [Lacrimispora aerotolerans]|uniref:flagellin N-terminal helical domain-containing protein n=1 Tax=Lacrimispora aerotolerans TaxID=36832 RepID=UPI00047B0B59|nr:flagellin [Lacrimispora aerotolerans]